MDAINLAERTSASLQSPVLVITSILSLTRTCLINILKGIHRFEILELATTADLTVCQDGRSSGRTGYPGQDHR
jgi:hypothetical protein